MSLARTVSLSTAVCADDQLCDRGVGARFGSKRAAPCELVALLRAVAVALRQLAFAAALLLRLSHKHFALLQVFRACIATGTFEQATTDCVVPWCAALGALFTNPPLSSFSFVFIVLLSPFSPSFLSIDHRRSHQDE